MRFVAREVFVRGVGESTGLVLNGAKKDAAASKLMQFTRRHGLVLCYSRLDFWPASDFLASSCATGFGVLSAFQFVFRAESLGASELSALFCSIDGLSVGGFSVGGFSVAGFSLDFF
jgi:hypothetical protein